MGSSSPYGDPETVLPDRVKLGALTLNEMRAHLLLDPFATAAADRPMVLTPTGYVPIEANAAGGGRTKQRSSGRLSHFGIERCGIGGAG